MGGLWGIRAAPRANTDPVICVILRLEIFRFKSHFTTGASGGEPPRLLGRLANSLALKSQFTLGVRIASHHFPLGFRPGIPLPALPGWPSSPLHFFPGTLLGWTPGAVFSAIVFDNGSSVRKREKGAEKKATSRSRRLCLRSRDCCLARCCWAIRVMTCSRAEDSDKVRGVVDLGSRRFIIKLG